jgi:hypothetical protein
MIPIKAKLLRGTSFTQDLDSSHAPPMQTGSSLFLVVHLQKYAFHDKTNEFGP